MSINHKWWKVSSLQEFKSLGSFREIKKQIRFVLGESMPSASSWKDLYIKTRAASILIPEGILPNSKGEYLQPSIQKRLYFDPSNYRLFKESIENGSIKKRFHELSLIVHPDSLHHSVDEELKEIRNTQFDKLNKAKGIAEKLSDAKRGSYEN